MGAGTDPCPDCGLEEDYWCIKIHGVCCACADKREKALLHKCQELAKENERLRAEPVCGWTGYSDDLDTWNTGCGHVWQFMDGGPTENSVAFCPFCGGSVDEAAAAAGGEG